MDLLAEVIATAAVRGAVAARVHAAEPWGLALAQVPGAAFHALTHGSAWLHIPGAPPLRLHAGDLVLVATGAEHGLSSAPEQPLVPFDHLAAEQAFAYGEAMRVGEGEANTRILCASYHYDSAITTPLLTLLPEVLHIPAARQRRDLEDTVRLLDAELTDPQLGTPTVLDRLIDILFIQLLRTWLHTRPDAAPSWLRGLADPVTAAALTAMHRNPQHPWTLDSLATHASVSRATLARRFAISVGDTPAAYLTRWRMDLAARRLRDTDEPIDAIARTLGYTSPYAFNRAFTRTRGQSPGRYRLHSRHPGTA